MDILNGDDFFLSISNFLYSPFKGNMLILVDAVLGLVRVLLHSSSGVINFLFGIIIYLTALFYLLSNSAHTYKPIEFLGQYNFFNGPGMFFFEVEKEPRSSPQKLDS